MVMRIFLLFSFGLMFVFAGNAQKKVNPEVFLFSFFKNNGEDGLHLAWSEDGLHWQALNNDQALVTPAVGDDKLMRDPCIIQGPDGRFHMVWTVSWKERGIGYASSPDLIRWSDQKFIPVMQAEPEARNCWAPEVFYDSASQQFLIFWSTTIPGRFPETEASADKGWNHRMYYVTTRNFETFSPTKLFYNQNFNVIDGTLLKNKGTYYLFLKDETRYPAQKNIRIARSKKLEGPYSKASEPITGAYWAEGPTVVQAGKKWIVYFDKYTNHSMGAVSSSDLKNWTDISDQLRFPEGARHGTVLKVPRQVLTKLLVHFPDSEIR